MSFWQNVDNELKFQCMERKELAARADFDVSYIGKGIRRNSVPAADLALRIANALNVSLEFLLDLPANKKLPNAKTSNETNLAVRMYHKHSKTITALDSLSEKEQKTVFDLIQTIKLARNR
ncbi:MAG: helix-turn-helix transcriptional regulator [Treponema sp.]|nr:helix-turn-helix transcriptional regulator [Treponema sp.]